MNVCKAESAIGIETFYFQTKGVGGRLRTSPSDFIVEECSSYPPKDPEGPHSIATVTSTNWETNLLVRHISKRLHISRKRIRFAGTKDKRAVTTQLMSFYRVPLHQINDLNIKDVQIKDVYQSSRGLTIGDLFGNRFEITIRNIKSTVSQSSVGDMFSKVDAIGGFPNFYGVQRFGIIRPITHLVGQHLVDNNSEQAVMTYLGHPMKDEDPVSFKARQELEETHDFATAFTSYPPHLLFEKAMLNHLIAHPSDFPGALNELPRNLLTMFVYAFQSFLFNKILSKRLLKGLPIHKAIEGDIVLPVRNNEIEERYIPVTTANIEKVNKQLLKGKAFVSGLLPGYNTAYSKGEMGALEQSVVEDADLDLRDFVIPEMPFLSSTGGRRPLFAPLNNLEYSFHHDPATKEGPMLYITFELMKGCYATSFLREIMKSKDLRKY
jgi:tRNA pseudouridine13 synthase